MKDWMAMRMSEKERAVAAIEGVFTALESEKQEPDNWEKECLAGAIRALFQCWYGLALSMAEKARTPVNQRSPACVRREEFSHSDLVTLRQAFEEAAAEPVPEWRHFRAP